MSTTPNLLQDQDFLNASRADQIGYMKSIDADFANANPADQNAYLNHILGMAHPQTLAQMIRAKYPGAYDDMDDATLEQKILAKYPQYSDLPRTQQNLYTGAGMQQQADAQARRQLLAPLTQAGQIASENIPLNANGIDASILSQTQKNYPNATSPKTIGRRQERLSPRRCSAPQGWQRAKECSRARYHGSVVPR